MYEINFSNSTRKFYLPENWNEVTPDQLLSMISIVRDEEDNELARLLLIKKWGKMPRSLFSTINQFFVSESEDNLVPLMNPFFEYVGFEKNIMARIEVPGLGACYGFSDRLENVSAAEYSMAIHYYDLMRVTPADKDSLINFVATLYRPLRTDGILPGHPNWNGDYRIPYNEDNIQVYAEHIARLDNDTLYAIRFCFERIMKWMGDLPNFALVFQGTKDNRTEYPDFDRVLDAINQGNLGSINVVKALPILTVFNKLQWLAEEYNASKTPTPNSKINQL